MQSKAGSGMAFGDPGGQLGWPSTHTDQLQFASPTQTEFACATRFVGLLQFLAYTALNTAVTVPLGATGGLGRAPSTFRLVYGPRGEEAV